MSFKKISDFVLIMLIFLSHTGCSVTVAFTLWERAIRVRISTSRHFESAKNGGMSRQTALPAFGFEQRSHVFSAEKTGELRLAKILRRQNFMRSRISTSRHFESAKNGGIKKPKNRFFIFESFTL